MTEKDPYQPTSNFDWDGVDPASDQKSDGLGQLVTEFDWSALDDDTRHKAEAYAAHLFKVGLVRLFDWIDCDGKGSGSGLGLRAGVIAWAILPRYGNTKQTAMAKRLDLKNKQTFGNEVSDFRKKFNWLDQRFYSEQARQSAKEREQKKQHGH